MTPHTALLIPTYDNPKTIETVVRACRDLHPHVVVVDDGSGPAGRAACERVAELGLAEVLHRPQNGGKGAAILDGFAHARRLGFSHVLQVDGDGQHDLSCIPRFLEKSAEQPEALIIGAPRYDSSAPSLRLSARKITRFWVDLEVGRGVIQDAMIGFRIYPLGPLEQVRVRSRRMGFDIEVCVRAAWAGIPIVNEPVPIRYLTADEGGVSHFRPIRDNLQFSWMHAQLTTWRMFSRVFGFRPAPPAQLRGGRS